MPCLACRSQNLQVFYSEIAVHVEGTNDPHALPVMVFPQLTICMDCGFMQGKIQENELPLLGHKQVSTQRP